jgi:hypothetical protein
VEAGGVGIFRGIETRKLLQNGRAQKSKNAEIAPNWNVTGTRDFLISFYFDEAKRK